MSETWWFNGQQTAMIPAYSRGFAYGDGLFETIRVVESDIPLLSYHLSRLERGADRLGLVLNWAAVDSAIAQAVSSGGQGQYVLKLICTRSGQAKGYMPDESNVDILLRLSPLWIESESKSLKAELCDTRLACQPALAGVKHLNRLEQVMAARELAPDVDDGILLDTGDHLIEALSSNLIFVSGKDWVCPDLTQSGVEGVMQAYIKQHARNLGSEIFAEQVPRSRLPEFDEILLTNAVRGVRNLVKIGSEWSSSSGAAGDLLREYLLNQLHAGFQSF
jgi:4-amino-4-deoxychorismate lyase